MTLKIHRQIFAIKKIFVVCCLLWANYCGKVPFTTKFQKINFKWRKEISNYLIEIAILWRKFMTYLYVLYLLSLFLYSHIYLQFHVSFTKQERTTPCSYITQLYFRQFVFLSNGSSSVSVGRLCWRWRVEWNNQSATNVPTEATYKTLSVCRLDFFPDRHEWR